jgi:hypothetical protein
MGAYTDKKENEILLIRKFRWERLQSDTRKGFLIYEEMRKFLTIMRRPLVMYDFATAPF